MRSNELISQVGRVVAENEVLKRRCEELTANRDNLARKVRELLDENNALRDELAAADHTTYDSYFAAIERGAEANRRRADAERAQR